MNNKRTPRFAAAIAVIAFSMAVMALTGCDWLDEVLDEIINTVSTPTANPPAGAVASGTTVTLSCAEAGAVIYYTTDGSTPNTSSTLYTTPITITAATTI